jgi:hypothetical protein
MSECSSVLLMEELRGAIAGDAGDHARGMADWGQRAVLWVTNNTKHIHEQQSLTAIGCQILTEIMEKHRVCPSVTVKGFLHSAVIPAVISSLSETPGSHAVYQALIVAILKVMHDTSTSHTVA